MTSTTTTSPQGLIFRLNEDGNGPEILKEVFYEKGWIDYDERIHDELQWNLWWKTSRFRTSEYNHLFPWQRINHCPKATGITRKDCLARLLKLQQALHGTAYDFVPQSFILPNDYRKFAQLFSSSFKERKMTDDILYWIFKPADMSRGRGIFIIRELSELQYDTNSVIQQYISRPYLISGYKFDIRLYVVVLSYHPLTIYMYDDGIVRFSCEKYDLSSLNNVYSHLTNTSINKHSLSYSVDKVGIGPGSKWTVKQLRHYFHQNHVNDSKLWWKIISIINLTVIPQVAEVPKTDYCFELYGFDVLVDENLKPWLLEVNFSPSLSYDCTADSMKKEMLCDLLDLLHYKQEDSRFGEDTLLQKPDVSRTHVSHTHVSRFVTDFHMNLYKSRPSSMSIAKLPRISHNTLSGSRTCFSANENGGADDDMESSPHNILTCGLSEISLPTSHTSKTVNNTSSAASTSRSKRSLASRNAPRKLNSLRPLTRSISQHNQIYQKPWRQEKGHSKIKRIELDDNEMHTHNKPIVGGFHRVYPFNMATRTRDLSPRQMVIETQQMIRNKILGSSCKSKSELNRKPPSCKSRPGVYITSPFPDLRYTV